MATVPVMGPVLATVGAVRIMLVVGGRPAVLVRLGVLAVLVRRQLIGGRTVLTPLSAVAAVLAWCSW